VRTIASVRTRIFFWWGTRLDKTGVWYCRHTPPRSTSIQTVSEAGERSKASDLTRAESIDEANILGLLRLNDMD